MNRLQSIKKIPGGIKKIPANIKHIPANIKNIPAHVRNIPENIRQIPEMVGDNLKKIETTVGDNVKKIPANVKCIPENIMKINHRVLATAASFKIQEPALSPLLLQGSSVRRRIPMRRVARPRMMGSSSLTHSEVSVEVQPLSPNISRHLTVGGMDDVGGKDLLSDARQVIERQSSLNVDIEKTLARSMKRESVLGRSKEGGTSRGAGDKGGLDRHGSVGSPSAGASVAGTSLKPSVQSSEAEGSVVGPERSVAASAASTPGSATTPESSLGRAREVATTGTATRFGSLKYGAQSSEGAGGRERGEDEDEWKSLVLSGDDEVDGEGGRNAGREQPEREGSPFAAVTTARAEGTDGEVYGERNRVDRERKVQLESSLQQKQRDVVLKSREDNDRVEGEIEEEDRGNQLVYEFLWNDWELKRKVAQSATFPLLEKQVSAQVAWWAVPC